MNTINFKAKYLNTTTVLSKNTNGKYSSHNVSLVQMSNTAADKKVLQNLSTQWDTNCVDEILIDYFWKENNADKTVYMLTTQDSDFRHLASDKVIGLAEVTKNKSTYKLNYLQTRPDCKKTRKKRHLRPFKGVGKAMVEEIIKLTKEANIYLNSVPLAIDFYKKLGFEVVQDNIKEPLMLLTKNKKFI